MKEREREREKCVSLTLVCDRKKCQVRSPSFRRMRDYESGACGCIKADV